MFAGYITAATESAVAAVKSAAGAAGKVWSRWDQFVWGFGTGVAIIGVLAAYIRGWYPTSALGKFLTSVVVLDARDAAADDRKATKEYREEKSKATKDYREEKIKHMAAEVKFWESGGCCRCGGCCCGGGVGGDGGDDSGSSDGGGGPEGPASGEDIAGGSVAGTASGSSPGFAAGLAAMPDPGEDLALGDVTGGGVAGTAPVGDVLGTVAERILWGQWWRGRRATFQRGGSQRGMLQGRRPSF